MGIYNEIAQLESSGVTPAVPLRRRASSAPPAQTTVVDDVVTPRRRDVARDATEAAARSKTDGATSGAAGGNGAVLQGVDLVAWRTVLAETQTSSSGFRLTARERETVEDVIRELLRSERLKTSMNELARLGLMLLAHDYREHGSQSVIYVVLKP